MPPADSAHPAVVLGAKEVASLSQEPVHPSALSSALLITLVGPKGSGKSTLGRALEARCRLTFFETEPYWLAAQQESRRTGAAVDATVIQAQVLKDLRGLLAARKVVAVATIGASKPLLDSYLALPCGHLVVRLRLDVQTCLQRIARRDASAHTSVDEVRLQELHKASEACDVAADLELVVQDNSPEALAAQVLKLVDAANT